MLQLKSPWRDGTTHLRMTPLEFMQRLAALVPRARLHLTRFHGVLAPNAGLRAVVVPGPAQDTSVPADDLREKTDPVRVRENPDFLTLERIKKCPKECV